MFDCLCPDQYYQDIYSIDFEKLKQEGIKGIICDIDNTIVAWNEKVIVKELIEWLDNIEQMGFEIILISNGINKRVNYFSEELDIPAIGQAIKPYSRAYKSAVEILDIDQHEIAVIGDQMFTDILGGNRMGFKTILVDPVAENEFLTTKILRLLEKIVFKFKRRDLR